MPVILLNGREALAWELPLIRRAVEQERERDAEVLAGVLAAEPAPRHEGRPLTEVIWEFS